MKWMKLLLLFCILAVALLAFSASSVAGENNQTDEQAVTADIVAAVPATPVVLTKEVGVIYYDDVGESVLICFGGRASALTQRSSNFAVTDSYVSEDTPRLGTILLWRNLRSAVSPIHQWIRA